MWTIVQSLRTAEKAQGSSEVILIEKPNRHRCMFPTLCHESP